VSVRHHPLKGLEGVDVSARRAVFSAYVEVGVLVAELQAASETHGQPLLSHVCQWLLGTDQQASEHEFLLRAGIVPRLHASFSIVPRALLGDGNPGNAVVETETEGGVTSGGVSSTSGAGWVPWSEEFIRRALPSGTLSRWELLSHAASAGPPPGPDGSAWFEESRLGSGDVGAILHTMSEAQAVALYLEASRRWAAVGAVGGASKVASGLMSPHAQHSVPAMVRLASTDVGATSPDSLQVVRRHLQDSAWALFKRIAAGAVGVRRRSGFDWMQSVVACHAGSIARDAMRIAGLPAPSLDGATGADFIGLDGGDRDGVPSGAQIPVKAVNPFAKDALVNLSDLHEDAIPTQGTAAWFAAHSDRAL